MSGGSGPVLGIDLGTTNSVVAVAEGTAARVLADPEGYRLIPSCVSFPPDGTILVGRAARERRLVDAANTVYSIKRLIGRPFDSEEVRRARERFSFALEPTQSGGVQIRVRKGTYSLPEISAIVLRHVRKIAEGALGQECSRAVITVPANFNELQRSATQAAGKVAGLDVLRILNEPTAATLAYGCGRERPETVAIYDLGGGTFDLTVLALDGDVFEVLSTAGDTFLGGDDVDLAIAEHMAQACWREHRFDAREAPQAFERMRAAAEWAKCQLSSANEVELEIEELFERNGRTHDFHFRMTRQELEEWSRPLIARTFDVVLDALRGAGRRPWEIDNVVLVGGSTRMPLVRTMVEEFFSKRPRVDIDPDLVVAQGAAIHAWTLAGRPLAPAARGTPLGKIALKKVARARVAEHPGPRRKQPAFAPEEGSGPATAAGVSAPVEVVEVIAPLENVRTPSARSGTSPATEERPATSLSEHVPPPPAPRPPQHVPPPPPPRASQHVPPPPSSPPPSRVAPPADGSAPSPSSSAPTRLASVPADPPASASPTPRSTTAREPPPSAPASPPASAPQLLFRLDEPFPLPEPASPPAPPAWTSPRDPAIDDLISFPPDLPSSPGSTPLVEVGPPSSPAPPAIAPRIPEVPLPAAPTPLLMDVTPLSLAVETVGGFCQVIVPRNSPVPAERSRIFSTARDDQEAVELRICQGESPRFADNQLLGTLVLDGIRKARRGEVRIEVTFLLDASGILDVRATDLDTQRVQSARIQLQGGFDPAEIERMRERQEREFGEG